MAAQLRLAQVHVMRTAGTFASAYLSHKISATHQIHNSWFEGLERDWTRAEMEAFADRDGPIFVHNHVVNWDEALVKRFQDAGFFVFAFVRDVGDQLCSVYNFAQSRDRDITQPPLDQFLVRQISGGTCWGLSFRDWAIPEYWPRLDFIHMFSPKLFERFVTQELDLFVDADEMWARPINQSANPGYQSYCERGEISPRTKRMIGESIYQQRFETVQRRTLSYLNTEECHE